MHSPQDIITRIRRAASALITPEIRLGAALCMALASLALSVPSQCLADNEAQTRIPSVTRLVVSFTELENKLTLALIKHDIAAAQRLLTDDFELRSGVRPGQPIPRADWLRQFQTDTPSATRVEQMAVHDHGDIAVVSFLWRIDSGTKTEHAVSVVDVWRRTHAFWQLTTRYVAAADKPNYPIPGAHFEDAPIEKKY